MTMLVAAFPTPREIRVSLPPPADVAAGRRLSFDGPVHVSCYGGQIYLGEGLLVTSVDLGIGVWQVERTTNEPPIWVVTNCGSAT